MKKFKEFILGESKKHTKVEARYVDHPVAKHRCDQCTMWRPPHGCSAVEGVIKPFGFCKWWKLSKRLKRKQEEKEED